MIIRNAQREAMASVTDKPFIRGVIESLRASHPTAVADLDDSTLQERIAVGLQRARRYGLTSELALACYVTWMFLYSPNFDEHPSVRVILCDRSRPDYSRIELVALTITGREWAEIKRARRESAWVSVDS